MSRTNVLILVILELTLRVCLVKTKRTLLEVLILVILELTLRVSMNDVIACVGDRVLILVILELTLRALSIDIETYSGADLS